MRETGIWMRFCLTCLVLPLGAQAIARPTVWDFESDRGGLEAPVCDYDGGACGGSWRCR